MKPWEQYQNVQQAPAGKPWEQYGAMSQPARKESSTLENIGEVVKYMTNPLYALQNPEKTRTIFDQGMQGATLGIAEKK